MHGIMYTEQGVVDCDTVDLVTCKQGCTSNQMSYCKSAISAQSISITLVMKITYDNDLQIVCKYNH